MEFDYNKHIIYLTLAGSRAYGTNTPESDHDYRGIIMPPTIYSDGFLHSFEQKEGIEGYGTDSVAYNIRKFFKLAADCNPNILEILFVPNEIVVINTKYGEAIRAARRDFLSKRARYSFQGYAYAQLKRIKLHKAWWDKEKAGDTPPRPERAQRGLPCKPRLSKDKLQGLFAIPHDMVIESERDYIAKERLYAEDKNKYDKWKQWKENRNPKRAELEAKYGMDCYTDDTEFLTKGGWKTFYEVSLHDELATVYIDDPSKFRAWGAIEYQKPIDKFWGVFSGNLYHLTGRHIDLLVTPNHKMLVRKVERKSQKESEWGLTEAAHLPDTFDVLRSITPVKKKVSSKGVLPDGFPISLETYLRLMGWFLSDGSFSFRKGRVKGIHISQKKNGKLSQGLVKFAHKYKDTAKVSLYTYRRKPTEWRDYEIDEQVLSIRSPSIRTRLLEDCGHKKAKRIPRWVFSLSKRRMEILFDAMMRGDGTIRSHNGTEDNCIYYSSIPKLADDVNELAFLCGWETSVWGPYKGNDDVWMYQIFVDKNKPQHQRFIRSSNVGKKWVVDRPVVCFTVPNGTLVVRRNGRIGIHGNSKHALHLVRLMTMCEEILRDHEVIVRRPDHKFLMDIRNGAWTYEKLMEWVEEQNEKLEILGKSSTLRDKPNLKQLNELCAELVCEARIKDFGK